jgi:hypothetical protein
MPEQRMNEHAVARLDGDLREIFVRAVHRVACLERRDARPAEALELGSRLGRRHEERAVARFEAAGRQHAHGPREVHVALLHHHLHAGMRAVRRAKDRSAFVGLVDPVLLGHRHDRQHVAVVGIEERDVLARANRRRDRCVDG